MHTHRGRFVPHVLLAVVLVGAVVAVAAGHAAPSAAGSIIAVAAVVAHVVVIGGVVGAVAFAARAHRRERKGGGGHGVTLHAPVAYDFLAALYTLGREGRMRARTLDFAGVKPGDRVLDVCCGTGTLALAAHKRGCVVAGIDASPEMIERANAKSAAKAGGAVAFDVAQAQALPFADASFDVVTCSLALHHMPPGVRTQAAREMKRVLQPGGRVLVVEFGRDPRISALLHPLAFMHRKKEKFLDLAAAAMNDAGFTSVEVGSLDFADLGYVRAS